MHPRKIFLAAVILVAACKTKEIPATDVEGAYERARIRLEANFNTVDSFTAEGLARVTLNDTSSYIDSTGKLLIPYKYNVQRFYEGLGLVEEGENGPYYFIDKTGKKVLDLPGYTNGFSFHGGYAVMANKKGLYGMIDKAGKEVIPCIYEEGPQLLNGDNYIVHPVGGGRIIINIKGGTPLPLKNFRELYYDDAGKKYALSTDSGWFLLDDKGAVIKKMPCDGVLYPREGTYVVNRDSVGKGTEWALLNSDGDIIVPYGKYNAIEQMSEGLACVGIETGTSPNKEQEGVTDVHQKIGYIDKTGKEVIPLLFEDMQQSFYGGLAIAMQKGKVGYIDKTGKWVIPPQFDKAEPFSHGYAKVAVAGEHYYIDIKGNKLL